MRFVNRNAYIMCAIKSTNFCASAKDAFTLIMRNVARYGWKSWIQRCFNRMDGGRSKI